MKRQTAQLTLNLIFLLTTLFASVLLLSARQVDLAIVMMLFGLTMDVLWNLYMMIDSSVPPVQKTITIKKQPQIVMNERQFATLLHFLRPKPAPKTRI